MANPYAKKHEGKVVVITTPSPYGSHSSMIVEEGENYVKCKDDIGVYITSRKHINSGLADPNRFSRLE